MATVVIYEDGTRVPITKVTVLRGASRRRAAKNSTKGRAGRRAVRFTDSPQEDTNSYWTGFSTK